MGFRSKDNIKVELTVRRTPFSFDSTSFGVKEDIKVEKVERLLEVN